MCHHRVTRNCDLKKTPEENYDAYSFFIFSTVDLWKKSFKKTRENNVKKETFAITITYYYTRDNNCYKDENYVEMILLLLFLLCLDLIAICHLIAISQIDTWQVDISADF